MSDKLTPEQTVQPVLESEPQKLASLYPLEVWKGTLYYDYAILCGKENYIPYEFFVEALKTTVGAIVSRKLYIVNVEGGTSRFYTVLIADPSAGKNTAINWTTSVFETKLPANPNAEDFNSRLLWKPQDTANKILGACITQASSGSGLAKYLPSEKSAAQAQEDLLFKYTELSTFLEKCQIDGSGLALLAAICDLYDGEDFSIPALSDQKPFGGQLRASILAGIQPDRWDDLASGKGVEHSGIHSRWGAIPSKENRTVATLTKPEFSHFREEIRALLLKAVPLFADLSAITTMGEWFNKLQQVVSDRPYLTRANIYAWRNALHYAWLKGKTSVDAESVSAGIALANYQILMRKRYEPLIGDSRFDKTVNAIRRYLAEHGTVSLSTLKRGVNYKRLNDVFAKALGFLFQQGEIEKVGNLISIVKEVA